MIKAYTVSQKDEWENITRAFDKCDVYYLNGYVRAFFHHGDGEPLLIYFENEDTCAINVVMKRNLADFSCFNGRTDAGEFFDIATPYGYGGWIFNSIPTKESLEILDNEYTLFCRTESIVSEFVRFHPVLNNAHTVDGLYNVVDLGNTIAMSIGDKDGIFSNIRSKNRNMIRKAEKNGIEIFHSSEEKYYEVFRKIYNETMDRDSASKYYYFDKGFYDSIRTDLSEYSELYYAVLNGEIIGASIILKYGQTAHYHLSGAKKKFMNLAPMNLLLYRAACDCSDAGCKYFHLGGGVGADNESGLYKFKESFAKNGIYNFSIGKKIFDREKYDYLVGLRAYEDNFNLSSTFFPLYRVNI